MSRRALALVILLATLAGVASAEEEAAWTRHTLGQGPATIDLPPTWRAISPTRQRSAVSVFSTRRSRAARLARKMAH